MFIVDRLVDEIEKTFQRTLGVCLTEKNSHVSPDEGLSALVDAVEQVDESLSRDLRQGLGDRFAKNIPIADNFEIRSVRHLEDVVGPAQNGCEAMELARTGGEDAVAPR